MHPAPHHWRQNWHSTLQELWKIRESQKTRITDKSGKTPKHLCGWTNQTSLKNPKLLFITPLLWFQLSFIFSDDKQFSGLDLSDNVGLRVDRLCLDQEVSFLIRKDMHAGPSESSPKRGNRNLVLEEVTMPVASGGSPPWCCLKTHSSDAPTTSDNAVWRVQGRACPVSSTGEGKTSIHRE